MLFCLYSTYCQKRLLSCHGVDVLSSSLSCYRKKNQVTPRAQSWDYRNTTGVCRATSYGIRFVWNWIASLFHHKLFLPLRPLLYIPHSSLSERDNWNSQRFFKGKRVSSSLLSSVLFEVRYNIIYNIKYTWNNDVLAQYYYQYFWRLFFCIGFLCLFISCADRRCNIDVFQHAPKPSPFHPPPNRRSHCLIFLAYSERPDNIWPIHY